MRSHLHLLVPRLHMSSVLDNASYHEYFLQRHHSPHPALPSLHVFLPPFQAPNFQSPTHNSTSPQPHKKPELRKPLTELWIHR